MKLDTLLITAYAKAPQSTAYYERYKYIGVILEINKESHNVVTADATFMTETAREFFKKLVIGTNFKEDISELLEDVKEQYVAPSQNSLVVALKIAHQRYADKIAE